MAGRKKISTGAFWGQMAVLFLVIMTVFFWFVPFIRITLLGGSSVINGVLLACGGEGEFVTTALTPTVEKYNVYPVAGLTVAYAFLAVAFLLIILVFFARKYDNPFVHKVLTYVACALLLVSGILVFCAHPLFDMSAKDPTIASLISQYVTTGNYAVGGLSFLTMGVAVGVSFIE